jgi:hypothetical protein
MYTYYYSLLLRLKYYVTIKTLYLLKKGNYIIQKM